MINYFQELYHIDMIHSWMIGDTTTDIKTGKNAGLKTILVQTGEGGNDKKFNVKPDILCEDLYHAVKAILRIK